MKLLQNKKVVGWTTVVLGIIIIAIAIPAIVLYAMPLASGAGSTSSAMKKAFESLSLLSKGVADTKTAMILGMITMLVGAGAIVWGLVLVFVPKLTFKSVITKSFGWGVAILTLGMTIPASIALAKGDSKEIKALDGFADVNDFFNDNYKIATGKMAGAVYMFSKGIANRTLKATTPETIEFDAAKASKSGNIRDGLTYNINGIKYSGYKDTSTTKKMYSDRINTPVPKVKAVDEAMMTTVDIIWGGLQGMGEGLDEATATKESVVKVFSKKPKMTYQKIEVISRMKSPKSGVTQAQIYEAKKIVGTVLALTNGKVVSTLNSLNNLIFKSLLGNNELNSSLLIFKGKNSLLNIKGKNSLLNIKGKNSLLSIKGKNHKTTSLEENDTNKLTITGVFGLVSNGVINKTQDSEKIVKAGKTFFQETNGLSHTNPKFKDPFAKFLKTSGILALQVNGKPNAKKLAQDILPIIGMYIQPSNSLLNKLYAYEDKHGKDAASEGLYLYLARISELSSNNYFASTDSNKAFGDPKKAKIWGTYDQAGRVDSRALLNASIVKTNLDLTSIYSKQDMNKNVSVLYDAYKNKTGKDKPYSLNFNAVYSYFQ